MSLKTFQKQRRWIGMLLFAIIASGVFSACLPKKPTTGDSTSTSSTSVEANAFSVSTVKTASPSRAANVDTNGKYYSNNALYTVNGVCKGAVKKVSVAITPQSGATTTEVVNCSNQAFSWSKTFTAENTYNVVFSARDSNSAAVAGMNTFQRSLCYDATPPAAPTFLTPTTMNNYLITDGRTQITITGQILTTADILWGPGNQILTTTADPDLTHLNFSTTVNVPANTAVNAIFVALDYAGNAAASAMALQSQVGLSVPIAANELGGSQVLSVGGIYVQSSINLFQGGVTNNQVTLSNGSSGILKDMQSY